MKNSNVQSFLAWARTGLKSARRLFLPVALLFLAYWAWTAGGQLRVLAHNLSPFPLVMAWFIWGLAQWISPFATRVLMRILESPLEYRQLALIHVLRLPAKYLPGGIWQSVARFSAYRAASVGSSEALAILAAEHFLAFGISVALGMSVLALVGTHSLLLLSAAVGVVLVLIGTIAFGLKRFIGNGEMPLAGAAQTVLTTALFWILAASSFYAYWMAVIGGSVEDVPRVISGYLLSWAAGFAVVIAPQGIGVSEWVAMHLLPASQPASVVMTAVAGFRLVVIIGDLSAWLLALALSRLQCNTQQIT